MKDMYTSDDLNNKHIALWLFLWPCATGHYLRFVIVWDIKFCCKRFVLNIGAVFITSYLVNHGCQTSVFRLNSILAKYSAAL